MLAQKNLHVPLPMPLYLSLRVEADRCHRPATQLAREAIAAWLEQRQRQELCQALESYAKQVAGTEADLDESFQQAAIEHWIKEEGKSS